MILKAGLIALLLLTSRVALAEVQTDKLDLGENSLVIEKLERVLETMDKNDKSRNDVMLRLADVYAERARIYDMQQIEKNCETCTNARDDRKKALSLYETALGTADKSQRGAIVMQMAHLDGLTGQPEKARGLYEKIVKNRKEYDAELVGEALTGLGEFAFSNMKYGEALDDYAKALQISATQRRGYISYRMAWCYYHMDRQGQATAALVRLLQSPELLSREGDKKLDSSFQEETSRDLATFLARGHVGADEIKLLSDLSPANTRADNLAYLGSELDRLGKKSAAIQVWNIVGAERQDKPKNQIENHIRLAQLQYDIGRKDLAAAELETAAVFWKKESCGEEDECNTLRSKMKKLVTAWGKADEKNPSSELIRAYAAYVGVFPDAEMNYWAATASRSMGKYTQAVAFYRAASHLSQEQLGGKPSSKGDDNTKLQHIFEGSLLGEIEVAELSKDSKMRDDAYAHYLELNPQGDKVLEVRYQRAHILYEMARYADAAEAFRNVALAKDDAAGSSSELEARGAKSAVTLKEKSADLALDSLVLAKDSDRLEAWAAEFAKKFAHRHSDYSGIARRAILNRVALVLNDAGSNRSQLEDAMNRLNSLNISDVPQKDRAMIFKDRLILAERLQNLPEVQKSASQLLAVRGLSLEDREFALSREAWAAEMQLNFAEAFAITKRLKMTKLSEEEKLLKLGILAELAGRNPEPYYREYVAISNDRATSLGIVVKLIRRSRQPAAEFAKHQALLKTNPDLMANMAIEIFARNHNYAMAREVLAVKGVKATVAGQGLERFVFFNEVRQFGRVINAARLNVWNSKALKRTLNERLKLLDRAAQYAKSSINAGDVTAQALTIDLVAREYKRLAGEISRIPVPRGLKSNQRVEYRQLLAQQAAPYIQKAQQASAKLDELWNHNDVVGSFSQAWTNTHGPARDLIKNEIALVLKTAPLDKQRELTRVTLQREMKPSSEILREAFTQVKSDPFSMSKLEKLKNLEERQGSETIVAYLDARLAHLQSGVKK